MAKVDKKLLRHLISSADCHNRIVEESEMWRQRREEKTRKDKEEETRQRQSAKTSTELIQRDPSIRERKERLLARQAEQSSEDAKWDHTGFMELHPECFRSELRKQYVEKRRAEKLREQGIDPRSVDPDKKAAANAEGDDAGESSSQKKRRKKEKKKRKKKKKSKKESSESSSEDSDTDNDLYGPSLHLMSST